MKMESMNIASHREFDLDEYLDTLTGIPEVDFRILNNLDVKDLVNACRINKYVNSLCQSDYLWQGRVADRYQQMKIQKPEAMTWQEYYFALPYFHPRLEAKKFDQVVKDANYPILRSLIQLGFLAYIYLVIIRLQRLDVLQGLDERNLLNLTPEQKQQFTDEAIRRGNTQFLDWFATKGILPSPEAMQLAIRSRQLPSVQWLHQHGYQVQPQYLQQAGIMFGSAEIRQWLRQQGLIH